MFFWLAGYRLVGTSPSLLRVVRLPFQLLQSTRKEREKRLEVFEILQNVTWKDKISNEVVLKKLNEKLVTLK